MSEIKVWPDPVEVEVTYRPKDNMIDRVAKALVACGEGTEAGDWPEGMSDKSKGFWRAYAEAAIEAMRNPPVELVISAVESGPFFINRFNAVIDAALAEPDQLAPTRLDGDSIGG